MCVRVSPFWTARREGETAKWGDTEVRRNTPPLLQSETPGMDCSVCSPLPTWAPLGQHSAQQPDFSHVSLTAWWEPRLAESHNWKSPWRLCSLEVGATEQSSRTKARGRQPEVRVVEEPGECGVNWVRRKRGESEEKGERGAYKFHQPPSGGRGAGDPRELQGLLLFSCPLRAHSLILHLPPPPSHTSHWGLRRQTRSETK